MAKLFDDAPRAKSEQASADAERARCNCQKGAALDTALTAFYVPATRTTPPRMTESVLAGVGIAEIEHAQRAMTKTRAKAETIPLHPKVRPLGLPVEQSALLSLVVRADEREKGRSPISVTRSDAANVLGVSLDDGEAAINGLRARGLIDYRDDGSGNRGYFPRLPP